MELVTTRLVLREYKQSDFDAFTGSRQSQRWPRSWNGIQTLPKTPKPSGRIRGGAGRVASDEYTLAATESVSDLFGSVGIYDGSGKAHAEMGFVISPDRWGSGYTTEAADADLRFGFEGLGLPSRCPRADSRRTRTSALIRRI